MSSKQRFAAVIVAVAFVLGIAVGVVGVQAQGGDSVVTPLPAADTYQPSSGEADLSAVYEQIIPSIVNISVATGRGSFGTGSGFVIDAQGYIVTNNHVVEGADYIEVAFVDNTVLSAELVGRDPDSDLAVIKVDPSRIALTPVQFADSSDVFIGQEVMAIGSPFGAGQAFTLTTGIVSGLDRSLTQANQFSIPELIQTDAAINPGNSGGPLLDRAGRVVGVNTAILSESRSASGVGFAIPSNTVRRIVPYLIADGAFDHSWLGISGTTVSTAQADAMQLPDDVRGVIVSDVVRGGPAESAGLRGSTDAVNTPFGPAVINGDIIAAINGEPIAQMGDLIAYLETRTLPGDTVTLRVWRDGQYIDLSVTLQARPTSDL